MTSNSPAKYITIVVRMPFQKSMSKGSKAGLPPVLRAFLSLLLTLTALCFVTELVCVHVFHLGFPYNWPLLPSYPSRFTDYTIFRTRFAYFHSPQFFTAPHTPFTYPAPVGIFYRIFYTVPKTFPFVALIFFSGLLTCFLFIRTLRAKHLSRRASFWFVAVTFCCSYPFFFELEQANMEIMIAILVACGTLAFLRRHGSLAAVLFGIAAAAKLFPFVFIGLFLARKQYREIVLLLVTVLTVTLASLWLLCPDLTASWHGIEAGLAYFRTEFVLQVRPILVGVNHSLFSFVQFAIMSRHLRQSAYSFGKPSTLAFLSSLYLLIAAVVGVCIYFLRIRKLPVANQVLCLVVASILLPPISFDYTLIHLYIPWAMLVLLALQGPQRHVPGLLAAFVCCAVVFAPETELIFFQHTLGAQLKSIVLLLLFFIGLRFPFATVYDQQQPSQA